MAAPQIKFAVYYGTITLDDGTQHTYSAADVAALYNVTGLPYLAVAFSVPEPFQNGQDYMSYIPLKPLANGQYFDAQERYNYNNEIQYQPDFVGHERYERRPNEGFDERI